jgi:hypothetical protein
MARSGSRRTKRLPDEPRWLQATITAWELSYHFGIAPPKEDDQFNDILTLNLIGAVHWPKEWKGVQIECYLRGDRSIQTTLTLGKNDFYSHDTTHVGYIHSVPRTTKPKRLVFEASLPKDMCMETAHLIRLEVWRAFSIYFAPKPPPADPKTRWITSIDFQATVDPDTTL